MIKIRLKKCPVCRSDVKVIIDWDGGRINGKFRQFGYCSICGYHSDPKDSYEEAANTWNAQVSNGNQLPLFQEVI